MKIFLRHVKVLPAEGREFLILQELKGGGDVIEHILLMENITGFPKILLPFTSFNLWFLNLPDLKLN